MTLEEITKAIEDGKAVFGLKKIAKLAKKKGISKIFLSSNAADFKNEDVDIEKIEKNSSEFAIVCKKPFPVSAVGVLKNAKNKKI